MRLLRLSALSLAILTLTTGWLHAGELSDDLTARRARLMQQLGPEALFVIRAAPPRLYSLDVDYEYRQDSNFYYLTGITQPNAYLVLMPGNATLREVLFLADRDPAQEHWRGRMLSHEQATALTGIKTVLSSKDFESVVAAMTADKARFYVPFETAGASDAPSWSQDLVRRLRDRFIGFTPGDAVPMLTKLRLVKTPYEQKVLIEATEISADAQMAGMHAARPKVFEYEVKAAIEAVHRSRGAVSWAYPSIVGSGPNATILHYPESERQMQAGDLLLVDAACNYQYMSPDITRTYPIAGSFTPEQKAIYTLVLQAQDDALTAATPGSSLAAIHEKTVETLKAGLLKLGLITDTSGDQYRMWFTHGTSHYIGIDVHDVGARTVPLEPGMAFVIEPGLYIRQSALDALPKTPENLALIARIQPAVTRYADIGIRVEDSFLFETGGPRRLSARVPRTIAEVERFMQQRPVPVSQARP
jgi:Xaa-Pro aminopeptidase